MRLAAIVLIVGAVLAQEDCNEGKNLVHLPGVTERVTPDYKDGPWFPMPEQHAFHAWTKRPGMVKVMELLGSAAKTIDEIETVVEDARKQKQPVEEQLVSDGEKLVIELQAQLEAVLEQERARKLFDPSQQHITDTIRDVLVPNLESLSKLYQTSAEIRYPFADRLAEFTDDLQKLLRAKAEAKSSLSNHLSAADLKNVLSDFDRLGQETKEKIDEEVSAAMQLLNGNTKAIQDSTEFIQGLESEISTLRANLTHLLELGGKFTPHHKTVAEVALNDQQSLLHGIEAATEAQDSMVARIKDDKGHVIGTLHHIASLISGLMTENESIDDSAMEPPRAMQGVVTDCPE